MFYVRVEERQENTMERTPSKPHIYIYIYILTRYLLHYQIATSRFAHLKCYK
jgi:hypothetical protein